MRATHLALAFVMALGLSAERLYAQGRTSVAVDAAVGSGYGKGGEFFDRRMEGARLGVSVRRWQNPQLGGFVDVSMDWLSVTTGHFAVCYISPRGGCLEAYPEFSGPIAIVGLIARQRGGRLEARAGVGGAAYRDFGPRVGAVVTQLDAAVFPLAHVGLTAGVRWIVIPRYGGDRLSVLPWAIGVRIR